MNRVCLITPGHRKTRQDTGGHTPKDTFIYEFKIYFNLKESIILCKKTFMYTILNTN